MSYSSVFLFFFGAIGVFNSFLLGLYFILSKKSKQLSNTLFGLFLLFLSERALRGLIYFFSDVAPNAYTKFGPVTFLFIGPFLFLYTLSVVAPDSKALSSWKYHILFWVIAAVVLHFVFPFRIDPIFYKTYIMKGINFQWLIYILMSVWVSFTHLKSDSTKKTSYIPKITWLNALLTATLALWLIYFFVSFTYFVIGSIIFSLIFYTFYIYFLLNKKVRFQVFGYEEKYRSKKMNNSEIAPLTQKLQTIMLEQKPYKNPKLKLTDLARELGIPSHQFSQLLNDNLEKSFSTFVNEYRIEDAKRLIQSNTKYTLDAIGKESGFNSKSSFYTSFKQLVGVTPSKYREQVLSLKL